MEVNSTHVKTNKQFKTKLFSRANMKGAFWHRKWIQFVLTESCVFCSVQTFRRRRIKTKWLFKMSNFFNKVFAARGQACLGKCHLKAWQRPMVEQKLQRICKSFTFRNCIVQPKFAQHSLHSASYFCYGCENVCWQQPFLSLLLSGQSKVFILNSAHKLFVEFHAF